MTTTPPELHLCIATGQNLANLIPALQCGAREVWILQTPEMHARAGFLASALKARDIAVKRIDFADDDVSTLHTQVSDCAATRQPRCDHQPQRGHQADDAGAFRHLGRAFGHGH